MMARRVRPGEWARLKQLRLRALESDPRAFGATLDEERALPDEAWRERAQAPDERPFFVAEEGDAWLGMIGGRAHEDGSHELVSMWTAPEARGRGAGGALVRAGIGWARSRGATGLHLWVIGENEPARRLYEKHGFVRAGGPVQGRRDPSRWFQRMELAFASAQD